MSDPIKLSAYAYLFNATIRQFDLDGFVTNATTFFDETIVSTVPSQDDTYERLIAYEHSLGPARFRVLMTDINPATDNRFDGNLKTAAMKECSRDNLLVIMDADERMVLSQRPLWDHYGQLLNEQPSWDGLMIPVLDLWRDDQHIRADKPIGQKHRLHKHTVVKRGVPAFAERAEGLINTFASDTTEPLDRWGKLSRFATIIQDPMTLQPYTCHLLNGLPYVLHYGWVDLERRAKIGREFWKTAWEARSGNHEDVITDANGLDKAPQLRHNLPLA